MARVVSISGHPYAGRQRAKGDIYEVDDKDIELMKSLKRVRDVTPGDEKLYQQQYKTRDMQAERGPIIGTRGNIAAPQPAPVNPSVTEAPHTTAPVVSPAAVPETRRPTRQTYSPK